MNKVEYLKSKLGEAMYFNCARWGYRGIVESVGDDGVVISSPYMIFDSNSYTSEKVKEEYEIPSDLFVALDAIEMMCQPVWAFNGYEKIRKEKK